MSSLKPCLALVLLVGCTDRPLYVPDPSREPPDLAQAPGDLAIAPDLPSLPDLSPPADLAGCASGFHVCGSACCRDGADPCPLDGAQPGAAWPMWQRCRTHVGRSSVVGPSAAHLKWTAEMGTQGALAIDAANDLYFGDSSGYIQSLDGATGSARWRRNTGTYDGEYALLIAPALSPTEVYFAYTAGGNFSGGPPSVFFAASPTSGQTDWTYAGPAYGSATLGADGTLYASGLWGCVAIDPSSHQKKWSSTIGMENLIETSGASIGPSGTVYAIVASTVYALDPSDGHALWSFAAKGAVSATAVGADGTVYAVSDDDHVYALAPDSGQPLWSRATGGAIVSAPAIASDGTIFAASHDGMLYALDAAGKVRWTASVGTPSGAFSHNVVVGGDDTVYFPGFNGVVFALDAATGVPRWTTTSAASEFDFGATSAIGGDGTLYVASSSHLFAYGR